MRLRRRLERLKRRAEQDLIEVSQQDGPPAKFPQSALREAFLTNVKRIGGGKDVPEEHPLTKAIRNSPDLRWHSTMVGPVNAPEEPVPDLSE